MNRSRAIALPFALILLLTSTTHAEEPFVVSGEKSSAHIITDSNATYNIPVGGTADMDNTATRHHETWSIAFQNNLALEIENTGDVPVVNPRIFTNNQRKWYSVDSMIAEFTEGARDDQERIYMIWEGLRQHRHHDYPLFGDDYHDPVRFLNIYGGGFCDDSSASGAALYSTAGFNEAAGGKNPFQRALHGHVMCEVWHDGDYQFMDIDQESFFLDRENRKPVSGDTVVRDHDYARRELAFGPLFQGWKSGVDNAALFGEDDIRAEYWSTGHTMGYTLRPGERITFHWDKVGKTPWQLQAYVHRFYSNSQLTYTLPTSTARLESTDVIMEGFTPQEGGFHIDRDDASMTIPVSTAYTICGATLLASVDAAFPPSAAFIVDLSFDGKNFKEIYRRMALPRWDMNVPLDGPLEIAGGAPKRQYWLRIRCEKATGAMIDNLSLQTDLYAYPIALPRLNVGENNVAYSDDTRGEHEVTLTHRWRESGNITPPLPPSAAEAPANGTLVESTFVPFFWPAVVDCDAYWLRVSRDPDFKYPYRPNYDVVLSENHYEVPFRGMFSPGETYYWRVRPRLASGLWGDWSETWSFTWQGPTVPKEVVLAVTDDGTCTFRWKANTSGTTPVLYRVYGSDEKGFSIGTEAIRAATPGPTPVFVETKDTHLAVSGLGVAGAIANRAFYRVVAVDEKGIESCPSDYVALPRPHVFSIPFAVAKTGSPYAYQVETITSLGDWQHRYDSPGDAFWEKESHHFELLEGPEWLTMNQNTGLLTGTPPAGTTGDWAVEIRVTTIYADEVKPDGVQPEAFLTPKADRNERTEQTFVLTVSD